MSLATLKTKVGLLIEKAQSGGSTDELEAIIDNSGVLDSTEGTVEEKVEQLVEKTNRFNWLRDEIRGVKFIGNTNITTVTLDCSTFTDFQQIFSDCTNLESVHLTNTQNVKSWGNAFLNCAKLKTIETLDFSGLANNGINTNSWANNVITLKIVPETIKVSFVCRIGSLSYESIQSIIDGLATVETAQTLTLNATVKAKLTQTQLDTITGKNWSLA